MQKDHFMNHALHLAIKGEGYTSPNPMVGAVIVKDGRIIGEGYHPRPGQLHAEIMAIEKAEASVAGATLFCTLEPCCHDTPEKRTPPCTRRIIEAGIARVVISTLDPNPHVSGNGVNMLRDAGIQVNVGNLAPEAIELNEAYFKFIQTGLPFVHLKMAVSLDGRIATSQNDSKWITDSDARTIVHQMRHQNDAVLIGANTVRADNPQLTLRLCEGKQPFRVVLDSKLELPRNASLLNDDDREKTIILTTENHDPETAKFIAYQGVKLEIIDHTRDGRVDLKKALSRLAEIGVTSVLVEGGGEVFTSFIGQALYDKLSLFHAPIFVGTGIDAVNSLGIAEISQANRLQKVSHQIINDQVWLRGYRNLEETFGQLTSKLLDTKCLQES